MTLRSQFSLLLALGTFSGVTMTAPVAVAQSTTIGDSALVSWSCTGSPCPWGGWLDGYAVVWPAAQNPVSTRLGYTTSGGVYLPADQANRATVWIDSGSATLYAGTPGGSSHRPIATVSNSGFFDVSGLVDGEVLSVQSGSAFTYQIDIREAPRPEVPPSGVTAPEVTWTCTGSSCPWGYVLTGYAAVWPTSTGPTTSRLGYTTSQAVYVSANRANGSIVRVESGTATVYAGAPDAGSHRPLSTINAGGVYEVAGVLPGEVLSVQSGAPFVYDLDVAAASEPEPDPPPPVSTSQLTTWTCTSTPCPWGGSLVGHALVWSADTATDRRLGYTTSSEIYLPAEVASGATLFLESGNASLYAGLPGATSHRLVGALNIGVGFEVSGLFAGDMLSVQSGGQFSIRVDLANGQPAPPQPEEPANLFYSINGYWRCNIPECSSNDWVGSVINWPSWAAYPNNSREGDNSRTVYSESGGLLYPYMGAWAHGCQVTAYVGDVLIIEWERGTDEWRETWLEQGQTHTIQLSAPEDGAMIETNAHSDFVVQLGNCTPQPLP